MTEAQRPAPEWHAQWSMFSDHDRFLFEDWIQPATLASFDGEEVLEVGCGGGHHTALLASAARHVTAVDLNTSDLARERNLHAGNVRFVEADGGTMDLGRTFDTVLAIGVVHHTDDPDRTVANLYRHVRPGGRLVLWVYSAEGNALVRFAVEPLRRLLLRRQPRRTVAVLSRLITLSLYVPVHTVYRLPLLSFLPYFEYFRNFRRLSFTRNVLNVFDKLNAPQTHFISRRRAEGWFGPQRFVADSISIRPYAGVSYSLVGTKRDV